MKRFKSSLIGVERGDLVQFSDFEDGGPMWTGDGDRTSRQTVAFSQAFQHPPEVQVFLTMWDMDNEAFARVDLSVEKITREGFVSVFKTWGDTRIARARVGWFAIGEMPHDEDWDVVDY